MNGKKIVGNGSKATLPGGKKMEDFKKGPQVKNNNNPLLNNSDNGNNNDIEGKEKPRSKGEQLAQDVGSEAMKKSLKAAFPYIPQFIINRLVDSKLGQKVIEDTLKRTKKKMILILLGIAGTVLMWMFIIVLMLSIISGPVSFISDTTSNIGDFFEKLGNWFSGDGYCLNEVCQQNAEVEYYDKLEKLSKKYGENSSCVLNEDLITATIFYGQMTASEKINSENDNSEDNTRYFDYLDVKEGVGSPSAASQVDKLMRVYFKGENVDLDEESTEEEVTFDSCFFSARGYRQYLIDKYIEWAYPSVIDEVRTKEVIADEIMTMGNIMLINRAFSSSIYCPSIAVQQENGEIESLDLEDYVARVITKENNWYEGSNIENMKAQAVAARTYALNYTKNCQNPIPNSTSAQTLADAPSTQAIQASEETNSQVLVKDGKVFSTQYDALAIARSDANNYYLKQANLAVEKTWLDSYVTQSMYEYYANHNHGNGLSQWGSRYLQHIGKNYDEILNTFYTPAELIKMGGLISGGNYSSNIGPAVDVNELAERRDAYVGTLDIYSSKSGYVSQCPWYAKSRAIEIVYGSNMDDSLKQTVIASLKSTYGNGGSWYDAPDSTVFTKTTDYTQPQPGSIVSWTAHGSDETCRFGHVAIIEQVNEDGTVLVSESWNKAGALSSNGWSNIHYQVTNRTLDYIKSHRGSKCDFTFNGYVYLLN